MILKKKEFLLLIFLILLQSCSGGGIGNFLELSFQDLENMSKVADQEVKSKNKKFSGPQNIKESKIKDQKNKLENNVKSISKNDKFLSSQNKEENNKLVRREIFDKKNKFYDSKNSEKNKIKNQKNKIENNPKSGLKNKNVFNSQKKSVKLKNSNSIKNSFKKTKRKLQSYKIIITLKDVDPTDPIEELSTILRNSNVNFEIEKIERLLDVENKILKIN